jgi:putative DNA primase/helicase
MIEALREAARKYYGAVGYEYLRLLVKNRASSPDVAEALVAGIRKFVSDYTIPKAGAQVERAARRFALGGLAGELVTSYGLTGWPEGEALKGAATCFVSWQNNFGDSGNREERRLLEQVRSFLEANGASRFEDVAGNDGRRIIDHRCGFYRVTEFEYDNDGKLCCDIDGNPVPKKGGLREYFVLPQAFRNELCAGFDYRFAVRVLKEHEWLIPGNDKTAQSLRLPGMGKTRAYVMSAKMWEDE